MSMFFIFRKRKNSTKQDKLVFRRRMQEENVGMKDVFAMLIAAFLTVVLPSVLALLVICGVAYRIFL